MCSRYRYAVAGFIGIAIFIGFPFIVYWFGFPSIVQYFPSFVAIGGFALSMPIAYAWKVYEAPILSIQKEKRDIHPITLASEEYSAVRVAVENRGRSAAMNCKAWICKDNMKERIPWVLPQGTLNVVAINSKDTEMIDFCAFAKRPENQFKIIHADEKSYDTRKLSKYSELHPGKYRIMVTSRNTRPAVANVVVREHDVIIE